MCECNNNCTIIHEQLKEIQDWQRRADNEFNDLRTINEIKGKTNGQVVQMVKDNKKDRIRMETFMLEQIEKVDAKVDKMQNTFIIGIAITVVILVMSEIIIKII